MKCINLGVALLLTAAPLAVLNAADADPAAPAAVEIETAIAGADQTEIGTLHLQQGPAGVLLRYSLQGLTPGWHGVHFHAVGDCSDAGFKKSGAHINIDYEDNGEDNGQAEDNGKETKKAHGLLNPEGPDFGDLPNIHVGPDGKASGEIFTTFLALTADRDVPNLLDADGSAFVVHAQRDDHVSQPIGGAGDRIGCAVLKAPDAAP